MISRLQPFAEFYVAYLAEHRHPANRALHLAAKLGAIAAVATAAAGMQPVALLAGLALAVVPCWVGHIVFERNRPTAWTLPSASVLGSAIGCITRRPGSAAPGGRPYYSVLADLKMCAEMLGWVGS